MALSEAMAVQGWAMPPVIGGAQAPLLALVCVLLLLQVCGALVYCDVRDRRIPNGLAAAVAGLGAAYWLCVLGFGQPVALLRQFAMPLLFLLPLLAIYAARLMGGGDVKLIVAAALWVAPGHQLDMIVAIAVAGGVLGLAVALASRLFWWYRPDGVPYGAAIIAGLLVAAAPQVRDVLVAACAVVR